MVNDELVLLEITQWILTAISASFRSLTTDGDGDCGLANELVLEDGPIL